MERKNVKNKKWKRKEIKFVNANICMHAQKTTKWVAVRQKLHVTENSTKQPGNSSR